MTPEEQAEQAERASLAAALAEYHAHPGRYLLPVLDAGSWTLPPYEPPPQLHRGYTYTPQPDRPVVPTVDSKGMTMAEYLAKQGPVLAPPSPGSSAEAAKLHDEDRGRITENVRKKRRTKAEVERLKAEVAARKLAREAAKEAEKARLLASQGSMLAQEGA